MMDRDQIQRTAALARLAVRPDEEEQLANEMTRIVAFVERVRGLRSAAAASAELPAQGSDALREDVPRHGLEGGDALRNAPSTIDGFFRVPRVIADP